MQQSIDREAIPVLLERISAAPYGEDADYAVHLRLSTEGLAKHEIAFLKDVALAAGGTTGVTHVENRLLVHFDGGVFHSTWARQRLEQSFSAHVREFDEREAALIRAAGVATCGTGRVWHGDGKPGAYANAISGLERLRNLPFAKFLQSMFKSAVSGDAEAAGAREKSSG